MNNNCAGQIVFKLYNPFSEYDSVKEIWSSLLKRCPHSYYLSWAWTEIWVKSLPRDCNLTLVTGYKNEIPVIAFFLGSKTTTRYRYFKFKQLALNQTLISNIDLIWIEYNAMLIDPTITITLESILNLMPIKSWDEICMIRCSSLYQPNLILSTKTKYDLSIDKRESYFVNLDKVRRNNNDYLALLSQNRRQQIRRSIKEYEKIGEIKIQVAEKVEDALNIFRELIDLHQKRWIDDGHPGALSDRYIINFHKNLISMRFKNGEIQLIKVLAGDFIIGCLYNLIYNGKVYFYVCGLNYLPSNLFRPGLVCHYYAIVHSVVMGLSSYDFLAGNDIYRKSLSTDCNKMETIILKRRGMKYKIMEIFALLNIIYIKIKELAIR